MRAVWTFTSFLFPLTCFLEQNISNVCKAFISLIYFQFCITACLLSVAAGLPSKLGGHSHGAHHSEHQATARQGLGEARDTAEAIGVRSFNMDNNGAGEFRYNFETENDIKQEAEGELREVDGTQVVVMKGSYSYIGADGQTYTVDWYADETGYHPSAPHLPQSVEPNHPEVAAAVRAQIAFAKEEEAAKAREASASSNTNSYAAPPLSAYGDAPPLSTYGY